MNLYNKIIVALLIALALGRVPLQAQEYLYEFGGDIGTSFYSGDLARKGFVAPQALTSGLMGRYNLNFRWAMTGGLSYQGLHSKWDYSGNVFVDKHKDLEFSSDLINLSYGLEFNFLPLSEKYRYLNTSSFSPYLYLGLGLAYAWGADDSVFSPNMALGFGAKYKINSRWTISALCQWAYSFTDKLDALSKKTAMLANPYQISYSALKGNDGFARITLSLSYAFGRRFDNNCSVPNVK